MNDMKINIPVDKALNMIGTLLEEIPLLEGKEETSEEYQEWETELKKFNRNYIWRLVKELIENDLLYIKSDNDVKRYRS